MIRRLTVWLMLRTNMCAHRSPEGWICTRTRWHPDLHYDGKGSGYAWGGD